MVLQTVLASSPVVVGLIAVVLRDQRLRARDKAELALAHYIFSQTRRETVLTDLAVLRQASQPVVNYKAVQLPVPETDNSS